jgi:hypothetical protein
MSTKAALIKCYQLSPLGDVGLKVLLSSFPTNLAILCCVEQRPWSLLAVVWALSWPRRLRPDGLVHIWWMQSAHKTVWSSQFRNTERCMHTAAGGKVLKPCMHLLHREQAFLVHSLSFLSLLPVAGWLSHMVLVRCCPRHQYPAEATNLKIIILRMSLVDATRQPSVGCCSNVR